jgi:hypothetical protein
MTAEQAKFEGWAVVEIMGHNREIGYVTTEYFGGPALFRIDQPELPERTYTLKRPEYIDGESRPTGTRVKRAAIPGKTCFVGPPAIFRITPVTEEAAKEIIEQMVPSPIRVIGARRAARLIEAAASREEDDDY